MAGAARRTHYLHTIAIRAKLGYDLREMLYAGDIAGRGSQMLEQRRSGTRAAGQAGAAA